MGRAPCCDKANVKKGPWSPEEDAKLKDYIEKYGTGGNWIALPQKIGLKRCGKSCRLRWLNYLRPNIKHGGFTEEEDDIICKLYISIGSRWSIIAAQLPGRTDNDIKNYWNTKLKKKLLGRTKQNNNLHDPNGSNENNKKSQALSNSALERLQLHMQLQSLQNPLSFYNNPLLWPKLHSLQEKVLPSLSPSPQSEHEQKPYSDYSTPQENHPRIMDNEVLELDNSSNGTSFSSDSYDLMDSTALMQKSDGLKQSVNADTVHRVSSFQAEIDNFLQNKNFSLTFQEDQIDEFDCIKEINGSKESSIWWSNELDENSVSSNSWDSSSVLQTKGFFQDYDQLGYSL